VIEQPLMKVYLPHKGEASSDALAALAVEA